jgi:hypothetical protein
MNSKHAHAESRRGLSRVYSYLVSVAKLQNNLPGCLDFDLDLDLDFHVDENAAEETIASK